MITFLFIIFVLSSSGMKNYGLPTIFVHYLAEKNVIESAKDARERDEREREEFS